MEKLIRENAGAFNHHYPKVAAILTAHSRGKDNAMTIAWHTSLAHKPPLYGVVIMPNRFTYQLITESKEFGINFLPVELDELVAAVGGSGGSKIDKFQAFNIDRENAIKTSVPILKSAYAAYECNLIDDRAYGDHRLLVGEIMATHWLQEAFTAEETLDLAKVKPIMYLGKEQYLDITECTTRTLKRNVYGKRGGGQ